MRVTASDGFELDLNDLEQTLSWNGDGTIAYAEVSIGGTYRQTYTYTAGKLTGISKWVKQ